MAIIKGTCEQKLLELSEEKFMSVASRAQAIFTQCLWDFGPDLLQKYVTR